MSQCQRKTKAGKACTIPAMKGSKYCFTHNPAAAQERAAARRLGGKNSATPHAGNAESIHKQPRTIPEIMTVLDYALAESIALDNAAPRNRLIVSIAAEYINALKVGELETRLNELLAILASRKDV